jgi:hypothetical protein
MWGNIDGEEQQKEITMVKDKSRRRRKQKRRK